MWSRPASGGCSWRRCISKWLKKSTSSRDVKGSRPPAHKDGAQPSLRFWLKANVP